MVDYTTNRHSANYATTPAWVEIAEGVQRRIDRCSILDLAQARQIETQKAGLRAEAEHLLAIAASYNIDVDEDLRDRLALWATDIQTTQGLVGELQGAVLQAA